MGELRDTGSERGSKGGREGEREGESEEGEEKRDGGRKRRRVGQGTKREGVKIPIYHTWDRHSNS